MFLLAFSIDFHELSIDFQDFHRFPEVFESVRRSFWCHGQPRGCDTDPGRQRPRGHAATDSREASLCAGGTEETVPEAAWIFSPDDCVGYSLNW